MSSGVAVNADKGLPRILQAYYESWESYFGYQLALGGAEHYGYYEKGTYWPFPISSSLERMQSKVPSLLGLPEGSLILEAGCGFARVAIYMAKHGMRITAIDILDLHVNEARKTIRELGLPKEQVIVKKMDYHHIESIASESHDGVYTVQALGHAVDLEMAFSGFFRVLKPGGRLTLIEAERRRNNVGERTGDALSKKMKLVNEYVGYPTNELSGEGYYQKLVEQAGFVDVEVTDYSENILPMLRICYYMMVMPFSFVKLFGLEKFFVTMFAVNYGYIGRDRWRFIAISATKPKE